MQTLVLTSSGKFVTEGDLSFLPKPISRMKIAYTITASKGVEGISYMEIRRQRMVELGYDFEEIDIDGKNEQELRNMLQGKELIYVEGGNTFYLLKVVRQSGFGRIIKDLLAQGVVYIGSSAGTYIACPTVEVAAWKHLHDYDHCGITDFTALNLVPFLVVAHYKIEHKELLKEKIKSVNYHVKILTDDQAILVQDGKTKLLGKGEEMSL